MPQLNAKKKKKKEEEKEKRKRNIYSCLKHQGNILFGLLFLFIYFLSFFFHRNVEAVALLPTTGVSLLYYDSFI